MKKIKDYLMKRKKICILGTCIVVVMIAIMGYFYYQNMQKQKTLESMNITFNEISEIEYGTKDYDVQKELVKEIKDATLKDVPKVDTSKIGEQTLKFILIQENLEKEVEYKVTIKDTKAPEIKFKKDSIEITVGDTFDINSNIESIKDIVDGDISFNDKALDINKKATEEYNNLNTKEIKNDTKVADISLSKFLIEDIQDKKEKNLYLKNYYYFDGAVDVSKTGEYKVNIVAVDKNGLKTIKEFTVEVKEKEVQQSQRNNASANNQGSSSTQSSHTAVKKGSIQDVMNTASAQVGKRYVSGGRGPDSFDCYGLVLFAFNQNGYNISDLYNAGKSVGNDISMTEAGDIIITPNHVRLYLGGMNSAQAMNPSQGIRSGYDQQIAGYFQWKSGDPNFSGDPLKVIDIRRVR